MATITNTWTPEKRDALREAIKREDTASPAILAAAVEWQRFMDQTDGFPDGQHFVLSTNR